MMKEIIERLPKTELLSDTIFNNLVKSLVDYENNHYQLAALITILTIYKISTKQLITLITSFRHQPLYTFSGASEIPVIDIVGTGGDGANSLNISTTTSLIVAAAGIKVAKHGNRSISSKCGSADLLEAWGVPLTNNDNNQLVACLEKVGITFFLASEFSPLMKRLSPIRKNLGFRTCFNNLGPFLNPFNLNHILLGVAETGFMLTAINILKEMGYKKAMVVHCGGLDELTTLTTNEYYFLEDNQISYHRLEPEQLGFTRGTLSDLQGGDANYNGHILKKLLQGKLEEINKTLLETIILNVAASLYLVNKVSSINDGCVLAEQIIKSGGGYEKLIEWTQFKI